MNIDKLYLYNKHNYLKLYFDPIYLNGGNVNIETKNQQYFIHENGSKPFLVKIHGSSVDVYKQSKNNNKYSEHIITFKPEKIFIGKSHDSFMTKASCTNKKEYDGNTILLYMGLKNDLNQYIYIGGISIFSFTTKMNNEIIKYESPMGANDVPYPYAVDNNNNNYLLVFDSCFKMDKSIKNTKCNNNEYDDPYDYYHDVYGKNNKKINLHEPIHLQNKKIIYPK